MKLVIEQCLLRLPPVLDVSQELVSCQQVTGPIEDSTIGPVWSQVTLQPLTAGKLTAELPGIDGRGQLQCSLTAFSTSLLMFCSKSSSTSWAESCRYGRILTLITSTYCSTCRGLKLYAGKYIISNKFLSFSKCYTFQVEQLVRGYTSSAGTKLELLQCNYTVNEIHRVFQQTHLWLAFPLLSYTVMKRNFLGFLLSFFLWNPPYITSYECEENIVECLHAYYMPLYLYNQNAIEGRPNQGRS